jgi:hypothetical protein
VHTETPVFSSNVLTSSAEQLEPDFKVLLDSQANISIFRERLLLRNIRQSSIIKRIGGISNGNMVVDLEGDHPDFGTIFFNPNATANVLCQFDMVKRLGCHIELDAENHRYRVSRTRTGTVYVFEEFNKLCMCHCMPVDKLILATSGSLSSSSSSEAHIEDSRLYFVREAALGCAAGNQIKARQDFSPNVSIMSDNVNNLGVSNSIMDAEDILREAKIIGHLDEATSLQGKMMSNLGDEAARLSFPIIGEIRFSDNIKVILMDNNSYSSLSVSCPLVLSVKDNYLPRKIHDHIGGVFNILFR